MSTAPAVPSEVGAQDHLNGTQSRTSPYQQRSRNMRRFLQENNLLVPRVLSVLDFMTANDVDLSTLLWAISWGVSELSGHANVVFNRTALMLCDELPQILQNWYRPPRSHGAGVRTKAAHDTMLGWALRTVVETINDEMRGLKPVMKSPPSDLTEENLLSIKLQDLISQVSRKAPSLWKVLYHASHTSQQDRNTMKTPEATILMMISMAAFSRSQLNCKLQKLNTVYFKSCGLAAKAFDTLHALGITMSQKTAHRCINDLSVAAHKSLIHDIAAYPWFGCHDNVNLGFKVYEQRLSNRDHFDSGTAATIVIIKDPMCKAPDPFGAREKLIEGSKNPITIGEIMLLEEAAAPRLHKYAIYQLLKILVDSPQFAFDTYYYKDDPMFDHPGSSRQLPTGQEYATCQYMLDTVHIEEASYEGNAKVLLEWLRQLRINTPDEKKRLALERLVVWVGDQLTVCRLRGLKKFRSEDLNSFDRLDFLKETFGWFHAEIAFEHSLHSQHYGTRAGHGLVHAFDLLQRKGLHSPSVQGTFHHSLQEGLYHVSSARFRDLWCTVANVESIEALRDSTPEDLHKWATIIINKYASTRGLQELEEQADEKKDDVFTQAVLWNRDILDYLLLDDAIKTGDIGCIQDLLPRLLFRFVGGRNSKYAIEILELLQGLYREWSDDLREYITRYCWLVNTTGRDRAFLPIDLLQEHNVRDIKSTFMILGPFATWDLIRKLSASIPCQRRIKDHIELQVNHFLRGKSHTTPDGEGDIVNLQAAYRRDKIHIFKPGRLLNARDKVKDYVALGSEGGKLMGTMERWVSRRDTERSTRQIWDRLK